jgi:division/cell wall cluster transcriptional repressor MraZ
MAKTTKTGAAAVGNGPSPYLGQHRRGVDNGRVILPVDWRPDRSPRDFMVLPWPVTTPEYLLALPPARWEVLQKNLENLSLADDSGAMVERLISSRTFVRSLDGYGRLPLPEESAKSLGIESEAMLVGRLNKFEIWSPSRYAATLANTDAQLIANALKSIKI